HAGGRQRDLRRLWIGDVERDGRGCAPTVSVEGRYLEAALAGRRRVKPQVGEVGSAHIDEPCRRILAGETAEAADRSRRRHDGIALDRVALRVARAEQRCRGDLAAGEDRQILRQGNGGGRLIGGGEHLD